MIYLKLKKFFLMEASEINIESSFLEILDSSLDEITRSLVSSSPGASKFKRDV